MKAWWVLLAAVACARRDPSESVQPRPEVASAPPVQGPAPVDAVAVATQWLEVLRDADVKALASSTRYPFELHDRAGNCGDRSAVNSEVLPSVISCIVNDEGVVGLLRNNDHADVELLPDVHLAAWTKEWQVASPPGQIVETAFIRNDSRLRLYVAVVDGVVAGLWRGGVAGSWAVQLATEWVDAVRHRDLQRLARVTALPLEVRDGGRDATCGTQVVKSQEGLARGVDCMLRSAGLHQAMTDSPASGFIAYEADSPIPDWIRPWWRENEHKDLQRVMTMVSTADGQEYNFQMLMARDGVRVVWKYGAFEARD